MRKKEYSETIQISECNILVEIVAKRWMDVLAFKKCVDWLKREVQGGRCNPEGAKDYLRYCAELNNVRVVFSPLS